MGRCGHLIKSTARVKANPFVPPQWPVDPPPPPPSLHIHLQGMPPPARPPQLSVTPTWDATRHPIHHPPCPSYLAGCSGPHGPAHSVPRHQGAGPDIAPSHPSTPPDHRTHLQPAHRGIRCHGYAPHTTARPKGPTTREVTGMREGAHGWGMGIGTGDGEQTCD